MSLGAAWCDGCKRLRTVRRAAGRGGCLVVRRHRTGEGGPWCPGSGRQLADGERTQVLVKHRAQQEPAETNQEGN